MEDDASAEGSRRNSSRRSSIEEALGESVGHSLKKSGRWAIALQGLPSGPMRRRLDACSGDETKPLQGGANFDDKERSKFKVTIVGLSLIKSAIVQSVECSTSALHLVISVAP